MDAKLEERLGEISRAFEETLAQLVDPEVLADQSRYTDVARRHSELKGLVEVFERYRSAEQEAAEAAELASAEDDPEMVSYLHGLRTSKQAEALKLERELRHLLVPRDPDDDKDVIVEIRAAVGGDEAALWGADLYRMYERFAELHGWKVESIDTSLSDGGGIKEATFAVKGKGAYARFKFEAGPHRVQRVPKTESQGRVHTSVATVAVLPEVEAVEVEIVDSDLDIDTFRSTGPGGQSVNTTDSAVRITHRPSGIVVTCQDEKSQLQNKAKAMRVLRARLYKRQLEEQMGERASERKSQVGTGERSEKIRTYNFKENRVTDHRIGLTIHSLPAVLAGDLDDFHLALTEDEVGRRLAEGES